MTLKDMGRKRKSKKGRFVKCPSCNKTMQVYTKDIIEYEGIKYIYCPYCGGEILLDKHIE